MSSSKLRHFTDKPMAASPTVDRPGIGASGSIAGLAQSLVIKTQRAMLDEIGQQVGSPVVYLKAAWADPVLYGGHGQRTGGDMDILVDRGRASAFVRALVAHGFQRVEWPWRWASLRFGGHAWVMRAPRGLMFLDCHIGIAYRPWYDLPAAECMVRAVAYSSVDGPILSLCPEDQVLYVATHYANHGFCVEGRQLACHLEDTVRLLARFSVDWPTIEARARRGGLQLPLKLVADALRASGAPVPPGVGDGGRLFALRLRCAETWIATGRGLHRTKPYGRFLDLTFRQPVLCGRMTALPQHIIRRVGIRILDIAAEVVRRGFRLARG
jgi:hypothetical protein